MASQGREAFAKIGAVIGGVVGALSASKAGQNPIGGAVAGALIGAILGALTHIVLVVAVALISLFISFQFRQEVQEVVREGVQRGAAYIERRNNQPNNIRTGSIQTSRWYYTGGVCIVNNTSRTITYTIQWPGHTAASASVRPNYNQFHWLNYERNPSRVDGATLCFYDARRRQRCYNLNAREARYYQRSRNGVRSAAKCNDFTRYNFSSTRGANGFDLYLSN